MGIKISEIEDRAARAAIDAAIARGEHFENENLKFPKAKQTGRKWVEVEGKHKWQGLESDLQKQCEAYLLNFPDIAVIRFPDIGYRAIFANAFIPIYVRKIISDYVKGIPDLILLKDRGDKVEALPVELKTATGKLSQGQKNFGSKIKVHVVRDFDTFVELVEKFRA